MDKVDIIIVGAGPIGLTCGIEAERRGLTHLIFDKGCIVNSIFHFPINMTFFSTSERLEIGNIPFVSHGERPTRREALEYYRRVVQAWGLNVRTYEQVTDLHPQKGRGFRVDTPRGHYIARRIIISTGFYDIPNLLNVPGEELPKVRHYYDEPHPYVYRSLAVIGGANSAVQVALETYRAGARVTMIVRESELGASVKYWLRPDIENRISEGSITVYFNSIVREIHPDSLVIATPEGLVTLPNDFVFAMTGYRPDFEFLRRIGVEITPPPDSRPVHDPDTLESNVRDLFLAGVVCGGVNTSRWFIENARDHADRIFDTIAARQVPHQEGSTG
ncbi:MAG: YpdA family putative bacillithiol disulfide reductase [Acidobacteria bacterium]|nr:YpdA family putative bacillithiol disulfide reductase [Acidobacteriota bacterium]